MEEKLGPAVVIVLVALAIVCLLSEDAATLLAGFKPFRPPGLSEIEQGTELADPVAHQFLIARDTAEVRVPYDQAAIEFLELYQIDFPHVRRQIAAQSGLGSLEDDRLLEEGTRFEISLTPPAGLLP